MPDETRTVVVIGAGFSGAMVTAHLLRREHTALLRVVLVNKSGPIARGVAYGTRQSRHVLNVPAGRMSAFPAEEDHFLRFVQAREPDTTGGTFVPRSTYGDYLASVLHEAAQRGGHATLTHVQDEARRIDLVSEDGPALVTLASGRIITADRVVLALGNYTPSNPPLADGSFYESARYIRDPWTPGVLQDVPADRPVLLIGTGLTMLDVALDLSQGGRTAPLVAVSRRGLTPLPHRDHGSPPSYGHLPPDLVAVEPTAVACLRAVRRHVRMLERAGVDWREVVASLRPVTVRLWKALPNREKARFLRHLRPYWDVHRHRVAPDLWRAYDGLRQCGDLQVRAGRLVSITDVGEDVSVAFRPRGRRVADELRVARVINCTGPEGDVRALQDPLINQVVADGLARPDALGIGLQVTDDLACITADGRRSSVLSLVGPLLKGAFWEATAVPELRVHAATAAARLHRELEASLPSLRRRREPGVVPSLRA
ncbi:MAG: FAD/NAD(P)-binding protein [Cytophagaceae bacterium]|nr:FAD/NAD(P)-binding protein [Gemmatimonadaceae bacterium]